jgi:hypothetical protein
VAAIATYHYLVEMNKSTAHGARRARTRSPDIKKPFNIKGLFTIPIESVRNLLAAKASYTNQRSYVNQRLSKVDRLHFDILP